MPPGVGCALPRGPHAGFARPPALYSPRTPRSTRCARRRGTARRLRGGARRRSVHSDRAGISTPSGIPDYRGVEGSYSKGHEPMQHADFVRSPSKRKRFWARSVRGYKYFSNRRPNFTHFGIAAMERHGILTGIVTQNVDRLHHAANTRNVVELHGRGDRVVCLECSHSMPRIDFTRSIEELNAGWSERVGIRQFGADEVGGDNQDDQSDIRADGDSHLDLGKDFDDFQVPSCPQCSDGVMMPDLVFFGGSIRGEVKDAAAKVIDDADALLVLGSSCTVYSSYRLVRAAALAGKPVALVNIGETRIDDLVPQGMKFETTTDQAIEAVLASLGIDKIEESEVF